ncbi:MAG: FeoB-associated Cys-rich membrane protein [Erysipelotrichaceae bacterium]|nr:FeoB-associated Cys-rich membrane protein [Erysipelotrichaceae bacterium]
MNWLLDNIANILVLSAVIALVYASIRSLINTRKSGLPSCGCGGNCANCALACMHGRQNMRKN